jgi:hypothetical protein
MENKIMKTNVIFDNAGLKPAGYLYPPDDEASPRGTSFEKGFPYDTLARGCESKGVANE